MSFASTDVIVIPIKRASRDYVHQEDLMKAARKVGDAKKHECTFLHPPKDFFSSLCSKTRVFGLIRSSPTVFARVYLILASVVPKDLFKSPERLFPKTMRKFERITQHPAQSCRYGKRN